ncbi:MAG: hypothetical protein H6719_35970 [Sandaracinaceae bacterium]|nr:hypothetical protein [Sandaracinaceae bacterium]
MRALILACALGATGCAAGTVVREDVEVLSDRDDARAKHDELTELERSVAAALDRSGACEDDLCPAVERICELSGAICDIAARHEGDSELTSRCTDGERRCDRARERVDAACGCSG